MRKPSEFSNFPPELVISFGPYPGVPRPDIRYDDGDTIVFFVDKGFNDYRFNPMRLMGINAPEKRGETRQAGLNARDHLFALLTPNEPCKLYTEEDPDQYGRYITAVFHMQDGALRCANVDMVRAGHAVVDWTYDWDKVLDACWTEGVDTSDLPQERP